MKLFSKNRINRVLELELEQTNNDSTMFERNYNNYNNDRQKLQRE